MTPTFWLLWSGAVLTLTVIAWLAHTGAALIEMLYVRWRSRRRIAAGRAQKEAEIIDLARRRYELESATESRRRA